MFSIAAINDSDSTSKWEPLAPTKEAQEFHLSQIYHEGLVKLQSKDYEKARELLESVLKDPLISDAQVVDNGTDGHLLQLRFLVLKNLATVFLQLGSTYYESALKCYLLAVEIDSKDSVAWNQLGTLACSMGQLSISRWAFEQGLICSPTNGNCMEKLLEVLIAIGDEVACISVSELILRRWPSHSRALLVKNTIEDSELILFAPRGIDKLEAKHPRLKFSEKRKATNQDLTEAGPPKRLKKGIELILAETSWTSLAGQILDLSKSATSKGRDMEMDKHRSRDISISIVLPCTAGSATDVGETERTVLGARDGTMFRDDDSLEKNDITKEEANIFDEQPQERRSSRLERLRSRKPGKEGSDLASTKDVAEVIRKLLKPFLVNEGKSSCRADSASSSHSAEVVDRSLDSEPTNVVRFVQKSSKNYGACHLGHLLLEEVSATGVLYEGSLIKLLELEKLTRQWGQGRTPECCLFLAELYYDFGICSSGNEMSDFLSEAAYHLCKVIEFVALQCSPHCLGMVETSYSNRNSFDTSSPIPVDDSFPLSSNYSFWVRFFWLSARLSLVDGDKEKAQQELSTSLSLLMNKVHKNDSTTFICLPHCKAMKNLTIERILHEVNLLEIDFLLNKTVPKMMEKNMYLECLNLLVPLLLSTEAASHDTVNCSEPEEVFTSIELSALAVLIRASDHMEPMDIGVHLDCHRRKLQILLDAAGLGDYTRHKRRALKVFSSSESELKDDYCMRWNHMVSEEVKEISRSASRIESVMTDEKLNGIVLPAKVVGDIQSLLLVLMCNIANTYFSKKSSGLGILDLAEQREKCHFVDAAIAFCILQHLKPNVPIKAQTELIVSMHDMLAEFGICYAHGNHDREEGAFLKLAIKHLLALDMKLKTKFCSLNKGQEETHHVDQSMHEDHDEGPEKIFHDVAENVKLNAGMDHTAQEEASTGEITESDSSEAVSTKNCPRVKITGIECEKDMSDNADAKSPQKETVKETPECTETGQEITEDEREELELEIENALDQCFYCLYGLNLRSDSSYEDELSIHKNTSRGDYQTKEQCADVFQYVLPYAKASSKTGLVKLRKVLRAIRKHFPQPPDHVLLSNSIDKFLDDPELCEEKLSKGAGSDAFLDLTSENAFAGPGTLAQHQESSAQSTEPYLEVYSNLYYLLALSEETRATDKWAGFILTKEGEEFVEQTSKLFKYDLSYNPCRFESWQRLANLYDEEVDLLLNDGSKQINVGAWQKNATLSQRVEASRRRSRRCLLMTLGLAKTPIQQAEIHELLALVYYDGLQNVVPFYDQRSIVPSKDAVWKMFCENSMRHFKKAFEHKEDWSHVFYIGKLCEKLGYPHEVSFSYYAKAIALNPLAVDPFYRLHASRLKLLCIGGKENLVALKVVASHCLTESTRLSVMSTFAEVPKDPDASIHAGEVSDGGFTANLESSKKLQEIWNVLYNDCLSALEICLEGDLKHFHKARYMLAQGLFKRGGNGDVEKAKEELSFCFKSTRSSFTINMWEIDSTVKKGRRKTPGVSGNKKALEVNLPESSRKFITCIRKYILFYLKLLEETGDISTLERSYISLRADKRFSLSLEDIIPVAVGRYLRTLMSSIGQSGNGLDAASEATENLLEKTFSLFLEHINLWSDICSLPEIKSPELTDNLYLCLNQYIWLLERDVKVEILEVINEKVRKRLKNPKLSNSTLAKVYKKVSVAWCRSLVISMALITPLHSRLSAEIQIPGSSGLENAQLLCVDLQSDELWSSSSENQDHLKSLESKWNPSLSKIKNVIIKRASDEDVETAAILLRSSFNFYKDSSCALLPSGINLYMVPSQLATETYFQPGMDGVDILDMNTSRKLLLWAYTLLHGYCQSLSAVIKYCEETAKPKTKKGAGTSSTPSNPCASAVVTPTSVNAEEVTCRGNETDASPAKAMGNIPSSEIDSSNKMGSVASHETGKRTDFAPVPLLRTEDEPSLGCATQPNAEGVSSKSSDALTQDKSTTVACSSDDKKVSRASLDLNLPDNSEGSNTDERTCTNPSNYMIYD